MSSILVKLTSRSDSYLESSNTSFYENKLDGVELSPNGLDDRVPKSGQKILLFWADCIMRSIEFVKNRGRARVKKRVILSVYIKQ